MLGTPRRRQDDRHSHGMRLLRANSGSISRGRSARQREARTSAKSHIGFVSHRTLALYPDLSTGLELAIFREIVRNARSTPEPAGRRRPCADRLDGPQEMIVVRVVLRWHEAPARAWATALMPQPSLLVLDEPTVDVDPRGPPGDPRQRHTFFGASGMVVLYTSQYMEEAERVCDRVGDHRPRSVESRKEPAKNSLLSWSAAAQGRDVSAPQSEGTFDPGRGWRCSVESGGWLGGAVLSRSHRPMLCGPPFTQRS